MAAQFTFTNGPPDRSLHLWMASAISSLPVPVSPWINTVASVGATTRTMPSIRWRAALLPIILGKPRPRSSLLSGTIFAAAASSISKHPLWLIAGASGAQLMSMAISLLLSIATYHVPVFVIHSRMYVGQILERDAIGFPSEAAWRFASTMRARHFTSPSGPFGI